MNNKQARRKGSWIALGAVAALAFLGTHAVSQGPEGPPSPEAIAAAALNRTIVAGDSWIVDKTTTLESLNVQSGAAIAAPAGHSLTMTVDGVESDIKPGKYKGNIILTVTDEYPIKFSDLLIHHFRQAILLDKNGIVKEKSVLAAAGNYSLKDGVLTGAHIESIGENFNGILVTGGAYTIKNAVIDFVGNGGNDFAGYGAGIMSDGKDTSLIVDGATIQTHGAIRTAVIGNNGSNLIVKNSRISTASGVLPEGYVSNVSFGEMMDAPWMLGIKGNVRATDVLGDNTTCTYINSDISSNGWGVLSVDMSHNIKLTAINSRISVTGKAGYGSYAIGNSTNSFYGSVIDVPTHGLIVTGGHGIFAASTPENVAGLNADLKLHLTDAELASLKPAQTRVNSARFGVMIWGEATIKISDGTIFNTGEATFMVKGSPADIDVDGSKGAQLNSANGVILQAINNDDPGPVLVDGIRENIGVYHDPAAAPEKVKDFELTAQHKSDIVARFSNITLHGNFYNAVRGQMVGGPEGGAAPDPNAPPAKASGMNLVLNFDNSAVTGTITAARARHVKNPITPADYLMVAEVVNTPEAAVNNGVVVSLTHSTWTVTGTSYLTSLTLANNSIVTAPQGQKLTVIVDGTAKPLQAGSYKGAIVLEVTPAM
jgi:hypothetical protein